MEDDEGPSIVIKRKGKKGGNARTSLGASTPRTPTVSDAAEDEGSSVVQRKKKSLADKVKDREAKRLSFGGETDSDASAAESPSRTTLRPSSSSASLPGLTASPSASTSKSVYSADYLSQLRKQTQSRPSPTIDGDDMDVDSPSAVIPTANDVAAARLKRETLRKIGADTTQSNGKENGDSFISLDLIAAPNKKGESRLVREEDEVGEGDDDMAEYTGAQEKVPLGRKATVAAKNRTRADLRELIDEAEAEAVDEDDEEAMEWEAAQVRRAGDASRQADRSQAKSVYRPATIPQVVPVPALDGVQSRLQTALKSLEISHAADDEVLQSLEHEVAAVDQQETELREEVVRINKKHEWFAAFYDWIEDVAAFLDTKYPRLEHIERDNLSHQRERLLMLVNRRFADDSDDIALFTGEAVQSRLPPPPANPDASPPRLPAPDSPFSDERVQRRLARQERRADSSDEVLDDDAALDLVQAVATLTNSLAELFADVESDDFKDPAVGVRRRFAEWRKEYPQEYGQAFGTLAMVGVWEFWARVEMGVWNPFQISQIGASPSSLDGYTWHRELAHYSHDAPPVQPGVPHDDTEPVSALVESIVVPRLQLLASQAYDLYSPTATSAALHFVEEITFCIDRKGQKFEALVQVFLKRIHEAVENMQTLVLPHVKSIDSPVHALDASAIAARERFSRRLLLLATQCLRWKRHAKGVLVRGWGCGLEEGIARELIGKVALPVLEAGWTTGGKEVAADFARLYPGETLQADVRRRLLAN